ncbi:MULTISPECIES: hypothetical protein [unclassified Legionella]|uniref:hypothetical protein n=1 Tax=unclassified Legionella TaxID=2622702 RepID=UPI00105678DA|nr:MULTISPECIES: hypothetical protein [unclassified Legionella]MDI9818898.1 hypothetical protein [Legionella sp. PL877]
MANLTKVKDTVKEIPGKVKKKVKEKILGPDTRPEVDAFTRALTDRLTKEQQEENAQKTGLARHELKAIRKEAKLSKSNEYWEKVEKNIQELMQAGAESYVEWATGINRIARTMEDFHRAIAAGVYSELSQPTWSKADQHRKTITPEISYSMKMDDTGHLSYVLHANGKETTQEEQQLFMDLSVSAWAKKNGYTLTPDAKDPAGRLILKDDNDPTGNTKMTKADFDELKKDPANGLHTFLEKTLPLDLTEDETLTSGPGMSS